MTTIMICVYCDGEADDNLGYWSCPKCNEHDGVKEVNKKEWYGEE
tara:strand:- start:4108 stop:4242 length:135 start_codon:yes stop_codon:yes gene_type:complete